MKGDLVSIFFFRYRKKNYEVNINRRCNLLDKFLVVLLLDDSNEYLAPHTISEKTCYYFPTSSKGYDNSLIIKKLRNCSFVSNRKGIVRGGIGGPHRRVESLLFKIRNKRIAISFLLKKKILSEGER